MFTNQLDEERTFQALADRSRRRILTVLADRPLPVHAIAGEFSVSRPAVSRHLRVLRDANLVECREVGRENVYFLKTAALRDLAEWLDSLWAARLVKLKSLVEGEQK